MVERGLRCLEADQRRAHYHLVATDDCRYLLEYHSGRYRAGDGTGTGTGTDSGTGAVRRLIGNFKCPSLVAAASAARLHYKERAIEQIAAALRAAAGRTFVEAATLVPIPPSALPGAPDYDDRLIRTLYRAFAGYDLDVRLLLRQAQGTAPDHRAHRRLRTAALRGLIHLDEEELAARPLRSCIVLFDDVLTTGKHYRCCERRLHEASPEVSICGWFIARRVLSVPSELPVDYAK